MRLKLAAAATALVVATALAGVTVVLATGSDGGPGQGAGPIGIESLAAERVSAPSGAPVARARAVAPAKGRAQNKPKRPQVIYLETAPQTLAAGKTGFVVGDCPLKARAMTGYYFIRDQFNGFGVDNEGDSPAGRRRWAFYLDNTTGAPLAGVTFGMVCLKNVK